MLVPPHFLVSTAFKKMRWKDEFRKWLPKLSPRTHAFRYGRQNENPSYDKRIELTTSSALCLLTDYQVQAGVQVTNYLDRAINKKK